MAKIAIRPIRIEGNIAYVPLTLGYEAIIDADDVHLVEKFNWHALVKKHTVYAVYTTPRDAHGKQQAILMHRVLMNAPADIQIDHWDGDGLNNRRTTNLRLATHQQNNQNQRVRGDNTSGIKGVSWHARSKKWRAGIRLNGKLNHLGLFTDLSEAAAAYATASSELHGEFGRLR